jgi:hypothetical protein
MAKGVNSTIIVAVQMCNTYTVAECNGAIVVAVVCSRVLA